MVEIMKLSRRRLLQAGLITSGGLLLGVIEPGHSAPASEAGVDLHSWIHITPEGDVLITVEEAEMGQGVHTSLPMLVAEELEADWSRVRVRMVVSEGPMRKIGTASSTSVRDAWEPLRRAGATARSMLIEAASRAWKVAPSSCEARQGRVHHPKTGRSLSFGELAEAAASVAVPQSVALKPRERYRLIGRSVRRTDTAGKVDGSAVFGIDVRLPDLLYGSVAMSPCFGGKLEGYDEDAAMAIEGVRGLVPLDGALIVVADQYWQATKGLGAAAPEFSKADEAASNGEIADAFEAALESPAAVVHRTGEGEAGLEAAVTRIEADYSVPFLAHCTMEPMNCTARVSDSGCEIWAPTQGPSGAREAAARALGLAVERVRVHTPFMGGGFGRRVYHDFVVQAVLASKAVRRPVKLIWTREEDLRHDFYRPRYRSRLRGGLDASRRPVAWTQRVVGPPLAGQGAPAWLKEAVEALHESQGPGFIQDHVPGFIAGRIPHWARTGKDWLGVDGAVIPYAIPHQHLDYVLRHTGVPVGIWRAVGNSQNAFFVESFVDELAHAAAVDPYAFRRRLLEGDARMLRVIDRAAELARWNDPLPEGHGRGIAFRPEIGSLVCEVAEVHFGTGGSLSVDRIVCVADCGLAVHPDGVRAQIEGGIAFGLSAALHERIDIEGGQVRQSSFRDYPILSLGEMPGLQIELVEGASEPGGVGELSNSAVAPAVANAIFAASGRRIRSLPLLPELREKEA